jgi:hypothetical protein
MAADPTFTITSDQGLIVEGRALVRWVSDSLCENDPWALVGAPIESMITAAGDAWAEFVLVDGNGDVYVIVAPEWIDVAACAVSVRGYDVVTCFLGTGSALVNGAPVRTRTPDWGDCMSPGDIVRVRYVTASRMVSVMRRGRAYELAALPTTADIAHMRFGVVLTYGNAMRVTEVSGGTPGARAIRRIRRAADARGTWLWCSVSVNFLRCRS